MKEEDNLISKIKGTFKKIGDLEFLNHKENQGNDIFEQEPYSDDYNSREIQKATLKDELKNDISNLYKESIKLDFYYFDSPFALYKKNYENRKTKYLDTNIDADEKDFLISEVNYFNNPNLNRLLYLFKDFPTNYNSYIIYEEKYKTSLRRKLEYLSQKLETYNLTIDIQEDTDIIDERGNMIGYGTEATIRANLKIDIEPIETKSKNQLTANQIILLLQELGFFIHPKIEDIPKVKQAEIISLITGLNEKNIKTRIEKLEKSLSVNGTNYQSDMNKINKLLDDLT